MSDERPRSDVRWLAWQPTPYNAYLFLHLAKELRLTVHYRERVAASHPWVSSFTDGYGVEYYRKRLGVDWRLALSPWHDSRSFFVVAGWDHPTAWVLLSALRLIGRPYALWTDTPKPARKRGARAVARRIWLRWILRGATAVMGTGKRALEELHLLGAPRSHLVNLPFFHDLVLYRQHLATPGQHGPLRLLSVGRIDNRLKGHDVAIRALAAARAEIPEMEVLYQIVGAGPDEGVLRELVSELGLDGTVEILGWQEPDALLRLYQASDVLLHPSPTHDPFPNAVLEAMAAGLVVLASDVSGSALDRVEHGRNGFLHRAGDDEELAIQIARAYRHRNDLHKIGQRARDTSEEWPVERGVRTIRELVGCTTTT